MSKKAHHVVANTSGGWSVRSSGASRAARNFSTQAAAAAFGRDQAKRDSGDLYVHAKDGTVKERVTFTSGS